MKKGNEITIEREREREREVKKTKKIVITLNGFIFIRDGKR